MLCCVGWLDLFLICLRLSSWGLPNQNKILASERQEQEEAGQRQDEDIVFLEYYRLTKHLGVSM